MKPFSPQTIAALTEIVTGGSGSLPRRTIGVYRTGPQLEQFLGAAGIHLFVGQESRVTAVRTALNLANTTDDGRQRIFDLIDANADPREFLHEPDRLPKVVQHLNEHLRFDGFELRAIDGRYSLVASGTDSAAASALQERVRVLRLDSVQKDFDRANAQAESDPCSAITSACSTVESVCKCILDEMGMPYPNKEDISHLSNEVAKHLGISPARTDLPPLLAQDLKQVLGGLQSVAGGIGALRTHFGDAHGKGKTGMSVDSHIARLAIHAASTLSLFYIESWQRLNVTTKDS